MLFMFVQMFNTSLRYQQEKQKDFNTAWNKQQYREGIRSNAMNNF